MVDVSIVIVCMNNLNNLYPCLESIYKYTDKVTYETLVVAYLFTIENLEKVKKDFPWITLIESNEIRGFSENNNLALRIAKGKYCFVLNDDTFFSDNVVGNLVRSFNINNNAAIFSPETLNKDGSVQRCGRAKYNIGTYLLGVLGLSKVYEKNSVYTNHTGIFKTYNISGAAFMIKRDVFEQFGWFDERYFFCPEDIALSTSLNKMGYECWVNADIKLTHTGGGTWSKTIVATKPASIRGMTYFFRDESLCSMLLYRFFATIQYLSKTLYWFIKRIFQYNNVHAQVMQNANWHGVIALFSSKSPKQLFAQYFPCNGLFPNE